MDKLAVFISCSHENGEPPLPVFHNIQVGAAKAEKLFDGMLRDNTGDNISEKNQFYCELTAQYYAWKNYPAEYLGFFHSRRYMSFNRKFLVDKSYKGKSLPRAYTVEKLPKPSVLDKYGYDERTISEISEKYPVISVLPEKMSENAQKRFIRTQKNGKRELELIESAITGYYPDFLPAFKAYMSSNILYFCNMFIMRSDVFNDYCEWLFTILSYADKNLTERLPRDDGMMGEQLFGIYMTYIKQQDTLNWAELPRIHFSDVAGASRNFSFSRLGNVLFPPGTFRRNILRKIMKG